jgi:AcrR family transcriptional regulator
MSQGRPRDAAIDDAARKAARELLVEAGWEGLSLSAVADRAKVSRPALYRRWPTKTHLVFDALFGWAEDVLPDSGDQTPAEWLRGAVDIAFDLFGDPAVRAGTPGLLAVMAGDEQLRTGLWESAGDPVVRRIEGFFEHIPDPEQRRAVAQAALAVLAGAPLFLQVFGGTAASARSRAVLADLIASLLTADRAET